MGEKMNLDDPNFKRELKDTMQIIWYMYESFEKSMKEQITLIKRCEKATIIAEHIRIKRLLIEHNYDYDEKLIEKERDFYLKNFYNDMDKLNKQKISYYDSLMWVYSEESTQTLMSAFQNIPSNSLFFHIVKVVREYKRQKLFVNDEYFKNYFLKNKLKWISSEEKLCDHLLKLKNRQILDFNNIEDVLLGIEKATFISDNSIDDSFYVLRFWEKEFIKKEFHWTKKIHDSFYYLNRKKIKKPIKIQTLKNKAQELSIYDKRFEEINIFLETEMKRNETEMKPK